MNIILLMDENFHKNKLRIKKNHIQGGRFSGEQFSMQLFSCGHFWEVFFQGKTCRGNSIPGAFFIELRFSSLKGL